MLSSQSQHSQQHIGFLLLLLERKNCDPILREIIVDEIEHHFTKDDYILYVSQLVQATKWDIHVNNPLIRLILRKAIESEQFAYVLYWQLQVCLRYSSIV